MEPETEDPYAYLIGSINKYWFEKSPPISILSSNNYFMPPAPPSTPNPFILVDSGPYVCVRPFDGLSKQNFHLATELDAFWTSLVPRFRELSANQGKEDGKEDNLENNPKLSKDASEEDTLQGHSSKKDDWEVVEYDVFKDIAGQLLLELDEEEVNRNFSRQNVQPSQDAVLPDDLFMEGQDDVDVTEDDWDLWDQEE